MKQKTFIFTGCMSYVLSILEIGYEESSGLQTQITWSMLLPLNTEIFQKILIRWNCYYITCLITFSTFSYWKRTFYVFEQKTSKKSSNFLAGNQTHDKKTKQPYYIQYTCRKGIKTPLQCNISLSTGTIMAIFFSHKFHLLFFTSPVWNFPL